MRVNNIPSFSYAVRTASPKQENRQNVNFGAKLDPAKTKFIEEATHIIDKELARTDAENAVFEEIMDNKGLIQKLIKGFFLQENNGTLNSALELLDTVIKPLPQKIKDKKVFYEVRSYPSSSPEYYTEMSIERASQLKEGTITKVSIPTKDLVYIPFDDLVLFHKNLSELISKTLPIEGQKSLKDKISSILLNEPIMKKLLEKNGIKGIYTDDLYPFKVKGNPMFRYFGNCEKIIFLDPQIVEKI